MTSCEERFEAPKNPLTAKRLATNDSLTVAFDMNFLNLLGQQLTDCLNFFI